MKCPKCSAPMTFFEGEDEFGTNELYPYHEWRCSTCSHVVHDYDDEFEYPEDVRQ